MTPSEEFEVHGTGEYIVRLREEDIAGRPIPPIDVGVPIAKNTLLVSAEEALELAPYLVSSFENKIISFPLDMPSGAVFVDNEDNWGVGPAGYDERLFSGGEKRGQGVTVGIADSGIDVSHPAFRALRSDGRLTAFAAFNSDGTKQAQHDADGTLIPDASATPTFTHWHGTFTAAIVAGNSTDGKARGVAPGARLAVTQVLQRGNVGSVASIMAGLYWMADQRCDIVSLSLGWPGKHEDWAAPIQALLDQGAVVVVAVGNEFGVPGEGQSRSPANYPIVPVQPDRGVLISVGAHDENNRLGDFSSGELVSWSDVIIQLPDGTSRPSSFATAAPFVVPTIVAPGVGIVSASPEGKYRLENGTSMSTPHVAGLIAVVLSALRAGNPAATARDAAALVLGSVVPLQPGVEIDRAGRGRVDVNLLNPR